jgi:hypothetical protein
MEFIKYEQCANYWLFKPSKQVIFSTFEKINYRAFFREWLNDNGRIEVRIKTDVNALNPSAKQVESIEFIIKNQKNIVDSIYDYYNKVLSPVYNNEIEKNDIVSDLSELCNVLGIREIEIPMHIESNHYYFIIEFDFKYDNEHGLCILFENSTAIDSFPSTDINYDLAGIYLNGLKNDNGMPLRFTLYDLGNYIVFQTHCYYDEQINRKIRKGIYRVSVLYNQRSFDINLFIPNHLERFSLKQILEMK